MRAALAQAELAGYAGDVPIGAVVLSPAGEVVGSGHNVRERDGGCRAGDARHVVVLRHPISMKAQRFCVSGKIGGVQECLTRRTAFRHRGEIENREVDHASDIGGRC